MAAGPVLDPDFEVIAVPTVDEVPWLCHNEIKLFHRDNRRVELEPLTIDANGRHW